MHKRHQSCYPPVIVYCIYNYSISCMIDLNNYYAKEPILMITNNNEVLHAEKIWTFILLRRWIDYDHSVLWMIILTVSHNYHLYDISLWYLYIQRAFWHYSDLMTAYAYSVLTGSLASESRIRGSRGVELEGVLARQLTDSRKRKI